MSADDENVDALIRSIEFLRTGTNEDHDKAYALAKKGSENSELLNASYCSFWIHDKDSKRGKEAFEKLTKMAQTDNKVALSYLGAHMLGHHDPRGMVLLKKAVEYNFIHAKHTLALNYSQGTFLPKNRQLAAEIWEKLAQENYPPSMHELGCSFYKGKGLRENVILGKEWLTKAMNAGFKESFHFLRQIYKDESGLSSIGLASVDTVPPTW
jgi:TPR repeat protein